MASVRLRTGDVPRQRKLENPLRRLPPRPPFAAWLRQLRLLAVPTSAQVFPRAAVPRLRESARPTPSLLRIQRVFAPVFARQFLPSPEQQRVVRLSQPGQHVRAQAEDSLAPAIRTRSLQRREEFRLLPAGERSTRVRRNDSSCQDHANGPAAAPYITCRKCCT